MLQKERLRRIIVDKDNGEKYFKLNGELVGFGKKKYIKNAKKKLRKKQLGLEPNKLDTLQKQIITKLKGEITKLRKTGRTGRSSSSRPSTYRDKNVKEQIDILKNEMKKLGDLINSEKARFGKQKDDDRTREDERRKEEERKKTQPQAQPLAIAGPQAKPLALPMDETSKFVFEKLFERLDKTQPADIDELKRVGINIDENKYATMRNQEANKQLSKKFEDAADRIDRIHEQVGELSKHMMETQEKEKNKQKNIEKFREGIRSKEGSKTDRSTRSQPSPILKGLIGFSPSAIQKKPSTRSDEEKRTVHDSPGLEKKLEIVKEQTSDQKPPETEYLESISSQAKTINEQLGRVSEAALPYSTDLRLNEPEDEEEKEHIETQPSEFEFHSQEQPQQQQITLSKELRLEDPEQSQLIKLVPSSTLISKKKEKPKSPSVEEEEEEQQEEQQEEQKEEEEEEEEGETAEGVISNLKQQQNPRPSEILVECIKAANLYSKKKLSDFRDGYSKITKEAIESEVKAALGTNSKGQHIYEGSKAKAKLYSIMYQIMKYKPSLGSTSTKEAAKNLAELRTIIFSSIGSIKQEILDVLPKTKKGKGVIDESEMEVDNEEGSTNIELDNLMYPFKKILNYKGCVPIDFARDEIIENLSNFDIRNEFCFIYNTLESDELKSRVGHWCAVYYSEEEGEICIYDPLGQHTIKSKMYKIMKDFIDEEQPETLLKLKLNGKVQPDSSTMCGLYCVRYLYFRAMGSSHKEASNFHTSDDENVLKNIKDNFIYV